MTMDLSFLPLKAKRWGTWQVDWPSNLRLRKKDWKEFERHRNAALFGVAAENASVMAISFNAARINNSCTAGLLQLKFIKLKGNCLNSTKLLKPNEFAKNQIGKHVVNTILLSTRGGSHKQKLQIRQVFFGFFKKAHLSKLCPALYCCPQTVVAIGDPCSSINFTSAKWIWPKLPLANPLKWVSPKLIDIV